MARDPGAADEVQLEAGALPLAAVVGQSVSGMGVSGIVALLCRSWRCRPAAVAG
jgi:hypothetical protein